ncbi:MAG: hypothetical protein OQL06_15955 [Gammaproteobacteria bacterium]|nr:hypothetical protein [Gammaproteobacteria bacterium]
MDIKVRLKYFIKPLFIPSALAISMSLLSYASADGGGSYSVYDIDRDGYLDRAEFRKFAVSRRKRSSDPEMWKFDNVDVDSDNKISEQEMVDALIKDMKLKQKNK